MSHVRRSAQIIFWYLVAVVIVDVTREYVEGYTTYMLAILAATFFIVGLYFINRSRHTAAGFEIVSGDEK